MFVACSTLSFAGMPLEAALRRAAEFEFHKVDLAIHEGGPHLTPSGVADDLDGCLLRLRSGPGLIPSALDLDFGPADAPGADPKVFRRRFDACCRLAKGLMVAVISIPAAPRGTPFDAEVRRLTALADHAGAEGLVLTVETRGDTLAGDPTGAMQLCKSVPGLGLTLDPSHFVNGPLAGGNYDEVFPLVQNVRLRDSGRGEGQFQVRVGQGEIEYGRIINLLERHGYDRGLTVAILDLGDETMDVEAEVRKLKLLLESQI